MQNSGKDSEIKKGTGVWVGSVQVESPEGTGGEYVHTLLQSQNMKKIEEDRVGERSFEEPVMIQGPPSPTPSEKPELQYHEEVQPTMRSQIVVMPSPSPPVASPELVEPVQAEANPDLTKCVPGISTSVSISSISPFVPSFNPSAKPHLPGKALYVA